jgi:WD40 repeat protein
MSRRAVMLGIAAGAVTALGGAACLAYIVTPKERFDPRPPILTYTSHGFAWDAAWSPDGTRVASIGWPFGGSTYPRAVHFWDATTGNRLLICTLDDAATGRTPAGVVWSVDGRRLLATVEGPVSSTVDRVQVWDATTGQQVRSMSVRRTATAWAMNDRYLAVATPSPQAAKQQAAVPMAALISPTPAPLSTPTSEPSPPVHSTPAPLSTPTPAPPTPIPSPRDVIEIWDLATGGLVAVLDPDVSSAYSSIQKMVWAPASSKLAVSISASGAQRSSNAWHIWDASAGKEMRTIERPTQEYDVIAWSRDGKSLTLGTAVYDVETGRRTATYMVEGYIYAQAWAPDGRRIAVWARTGTGLFTTKYDVISIIEASSGRRLAMYDGGESNLAVGPLGGPSRLAWSLDGKQLLVVRKGVEVWRLGQG